MSKKTKKTPRARIEHASAHGPHAVTADPHLIALLHYIFGGAGDGDYRDILVANAIVASRQMVEACRSDCVINDEDHADVGATFACALDGVRTWLQHADPVMADAKREALQALNDLNTDYDHAALKGGALYTTLSECADASLLLGAVLMYDVLKGGAQ
jgi:hypothetical protein